MRLYALPQWSRAISRASGAALASLLFGLCSVALAGSSHPYYRRPLPQPSNASNFTSVTFQVDLSHAHLEPFPADPGNLAIYNALFDARAAATVSAVAGLEEGPRVYPGKKDDARAFLQGNDYNGEVPTRYHLTTKGLGAMAYPDYFPGADAGWLRAMVSEAILKASPGWCGTFGPGVDNDADIILKSVEGNYDMGLMHLISLVYRYYDELTPTARDYLIDELIQKAIVHRPNLDDTNPSGGVPSDWMLAGILEVPVLGTDIKSIGETENHILMIQTARYLCNQLLYQRNGHQPVHDNRRNGDPQGDPKRPHATDLLLSLLRNMLRDDFSEYNAKNYQAETRWALLNLCSYAYDHEVRLAARLVLDYVAAHFAVSSSDLRRMVPFRRRNEGKNITQLPGGFMAVGLLEVSLGSDPLTRFFTLQSGQTRAYEISNAELTPPDYVFAARGAPWVIADTGGDIAIEVLSEYRLPPSILDLFVNDAHRRFFQRLHRTPRPEEEGGNRNCDNLEIYAGSPSYLITAGGEPARWAINPVIGGVVIPNQEQQLGVAVTTSFMPTSQSEAPTTNSARNLIQFGTFSDEEHAVANYGVAPDFACGHQVHLPDWVTRERPAGFDHFTFIDRSSGDPTRPGFFLAVYRQPENGFALLEAFDTWLHPDLPFGQFINNVQARNPNLNLQDGTPAQYVTQNGNRIYFTIWNRDGRSGAAVSQIDYATNAPAIDTLIDAGNDSSPFLSGTIMHSPREAVVEIYNPLLKTSLTLDMNDKWHPRRIAENGDVEQAGDHNEVWVDFDWRGATEGDCYHPFNTLAAAMAAVADGGVIKIVPGTTSEMPVLAGKRVKLVAPIGGVYVGVP